MSQGEVLADQYEILRFLGRGAFGQVYLAKNKILRKPTAVKVIPVHGDADALERMIADEYLAQRQIRDHEHVLEIFEPRICRHGGASLLLLPMEVAQQSLREWLDETRGDLAGRQEEGLELFCQACRGVAAIHEAGLVHLDVKPENLLLLEDVGDREAEAPGGGSGDKPGGLTRWRVKIGDFGLSRAVGSSRDVRAALTADGVGTPAYMAPEQIRAARWKDVGAAADIYGLGMILYEILDGDLPYSGSAREVIEKKTDRSIDIQSPPGPDHLVQLVMRCLSRKPSERPRGALELEQGLTGRRRGAAVAPSEAGGSAAEKSEALEGKRPGDKRTIEILPGVKMDFVWIPAGSFQMGSPESEPGRKEEEGPVHEVEVTRGLWLGKYAVTQVQWHAVMGNNPSDFKGHTGHPVEMVSWEDCQEFIGKLNEEAGREVFRLPTEAEWEYACRAGTTTPFHTGRCLSTEEANYDGNYPQGGCSEGEYRETTIRVGSLAANAWGLYDMHGNVYEWCQDWYDSDYYGSSPREDPQGPETGSYRVVRGGSWSSGARACRSAYRHGSRPGNRSHGFGLRLTRTAQ